MFKGRIKITGEIANFNTFKNKDGEIMVQKDGSLSFFRPEEVENVEQLGWRPASELPVIPEGKNWVKVVALVDFGDNTLRPRHEIYKDKGWSKKDMWTVKYWCYPPEKEK